MSEALSPSELRSLFSGLDLTSSAASQREDAGGAEALADGDQFLLPISLAVGELTAAQQWQAEFLGRWKHTWTGASSGHLSFESSGPQVIRLRDFIAQHDTIHRYHATAAELQLPVWVALDEPLVGAHLDCLLGARDLGTTAAGKRSHGPLEHQLTGRLVDSICHALEKPVAGNRQLTWQFKRANSPAEWAAESPLYLSAELLQFEFDVAFAGTRGRLSLGLPRRHVGRLFPLPTQPRGTPDDNSGPDGRAPIIVRATLAPIILTVADFEQLQVGDVLLTSQNDLAPCIVTCGSDPAFRATLGQHHNHKAIQLTTPHE